MICSGTRAELAYGLGTIKGGYIKVLLNQHPRGLALCLCAGEHVFCICSHVQCISYTYENMCSNGGLVSGHWLMISSVNYQNKSIKSKKYGSSNSPCLKTGRIDIIEC